MLDSAESGGGLKGPTDVFFLRSLSPTACCPTNCLQEMAQKGSRNKNRWYQEIAKDQSIWPYYSAILDQAIWQYLPDLKIMLHFIENGLRLPSR